MVKHGVVWGRRGRGCDCGGQGKSPLTLVLYRVCIAFSTLRIPTLLLPALQAKLDGQSVLVEALDGELAELRKQVWTQKEGRDLEGELRELRKRVWTRKEGRTWKGS